MALLSFVFKCFYLFLYNLKLRNIYIENFFYTLNQNHDFTLIIYFFRFHVFNIRLSVRLSLTKRRSFIKQKFYNGDERYFHFFCFHIITHFKIDQYPESREPRRHDQIFKDFSFFIMTWAFLKKD